MSIPNRKYVISLSGGLASAASAIIAHEEGLHYQMVFADTLIEHASLYRFIGELRNALQRDFVWLVDGRDPWDVFVGENYIGNSRTAHCSDTLKTQQVAAWMEANAFHSDPLVLGMYKDEEDRLERAQAKWGVQEVTSLLIEYKVTPGDADLLVKKYGLERPKLYQLGFPHNNCGGMCVRAGQGQFALLLETRREFYLEQEARNIWAVDSIKASRVSRGLPVDDYLGGFIRVTMGGKLHYLNMRQFRLGVESGEIIPARYEMGGCGCFVS